MLLEETRPSRVDTPGWSASGVAEAQWSGRVRSDVKDRARGRESVGPAVESEGKGHGDEDREAAGDETTEAAKWSIWTGVYVRVVMLFPRCGPAKQRDG
jgi:hypothetical protein